MPYRGQPLALTNLIGGQVQVDFASLPPAVEYDKAGKLRAPGVTSPTRIEALPDLPAMAEYLPGSLGKIRTACCERASLSCRI